MKLWLRICYLVIGLILIIWSFNVLIPYIEDNIAFIEWFDWLPEIVIATVFFLFGFNILKTNIFSNISLLLSSFLSLLLVLEILAPFVAMSLGESWDLYDGGFIVSMALTVAVFLKYIIILATASLLIAIILIIWNKIRYKNSNLLK